MYFSIEETATEAHFQSSNFAFSDDQKKIVTLISEYSDQKILKALSKKKNHQTIF